MPPKTSNKTLHPVFLKEYHRILANPSAIYKDMGLASPAMPEKINRKIKEFGGPDAKIKTFSGYIDECWRDAMEHSDTRSKQPLAPSSLPSKLA